MNGKRFLLLATMLSIWLVSLAISSFAFRASLSNAQAASAFYQRQFGATWSLQSQSPLHIDCFRRNWNLPKPDATKQDASHYFLGLS